MTVAFASSEQTTNSHDEARPCVSKAHNTCCNEEGLVQTVLEGQEASPKKVMMELPGGGRPAGARPSIKKCFPTPILVEGVEWFYSELVVFERKIFTGHTTLEQLCEVQELMENEVIVQPKNFEDRIVLMSMYNDSDWTTGSHETCVYNSFVCCGLCRKFP